jgi:hypothetical protein
VRFAIVQRTQNPIFGRVKVDCLDAIGPARQELLDLCSFYLKGKEVSIVTTGVGVEDLSTIVEVERGGRRRDVDCQTELLLRWPNSNCISNSTIHANWLD